MLRANEASVFFDQSYLKKEYTYIFHADRHLKKIDNRLTFDVRYISSQDM